MYQKIPIRYFDTWFLFRFDFFFSSIEAFETIFNILPADLRAPRRFVTLWGLIKTLPPFRAQTAWNYSWMVYVPKSVTLRYSLSGEKIRYKNQTPLFRQFVEAALVEGTFHSNIKYLRPLFPSNFQINLRSFFSSRRRHTRCREVSWARRCV